MKTTLSCDVCFTHDFDSFVAENTRHPTPMDALPDELKLEIFFHLSVPDLLSACLTCHKFNEIISKSSKLVDKFEVKFTSDTVSCEWIGSRNYRRFFINGSVGINFLYILKSIGKNIYSLVINCFEMRLELLKQILFMTENVRNLTVYNVASDGDIFDYPKIQLDLEYFYFFGVINSFKMFSSSSSKIADIRRFDHDDFRDVMEVKKFLSNQKNLAVLKLENFDDTCPLFGNDMLTSVDFRLKKIKLKNFHENNGNLRDFLEQHRESLLELEAWTVSHEILSHFDKFKNLKCLKLCSMCSDYKPINSVESLHLKDVHGMWTDKLKNVKNLSIFQNVQNIQQVENYKQLQSLKISNSSIPILKIPTVKKLTLNRVELEAALPFEYENGCNIEELKIYRMKNLEWLLDFLIYKEFSLKSLVVKKSILSHDDIGFIEDFRNRLVTLDITDCFGLTDEDIDGQTDLSDEDFSASSEDEEEVTESSESDSSGSDESDVSGTDEEDEDDNGDLNRII